MSKAFAIVLIVFVAALFIPSVATAIGAVLSFIGQVICGLLLAGLFIAIVRSLAAMALGDETEVNYSFQ